MVAATAATGAAELVGDGRRRRGVETRRQEARVAVGSDARGGGAGCGRGEKEVCLAWGRGGGSSAIGTADTDSCAVARAASAGAAGERVGGFALKVLVKLGRGSREGGGVLVHALAVTVVGGILRAGSLLDRAPEHEGDHSTPCQHG